MICINESTIAYIPERTPKDIPEMNSILFVILKLPNMNYYLAVLNLILMKKMSGKPNWSADPASPPTKDKRTANCGMPMARPAIRMNCATLMTVRLMRKPE